MGQGSNTSKIVLIALLAASVLLNMFLLSNKYKQTQEIDDKSEQIAELASAQEELQEQYNIAMTDLDEMKSSNVDLNAMIESQKVELTRSKNRISRLLKDTKNLSAAREEINMLLSQRDEYLAQIASLQQENEGLVNANMTLSSEKESLSANLQQKSMIIDEIESEKAVLMSQKSAVEDENSKLAAKVSIASVIKTREIEVSGWKVKNSGVAKQRKSAKNVDYLQICLDTYENEVANIGSETFFVRVVNPAGETMAVESLGSGILEKSISAEKVRYTKAAEVEYDQTPVKTCLDWNPGVAFQSGKYIVEVYNKGFLSGKSTFELK